MAPLELSRRSDCGVLTVTGDLTSADRITLMVEAIEFVPVDEHLVVDLTEVTVLDGTGAAALREALLRRAGVSETAVVSRDPHVTVHLVLAELDRWAPVLHTLDDAICVLRARSGGAIVGDLDLVTSEPVPAAV